jgi:hypothetical protein
MKSAQSASGGLDFDRNPPPRPAELPTMQTELAKQIGVASAQISRHEGRCLTPSAYMIVGRTEVFPSPATTTHGQETHHDCSAPPMTSSATA